MFPSVGFKPTTQYLIHGIAISLTLFRLILGGFLFELRLRSGLSFSMKNNLDGLKIREMRFSFKNGLDSLFSSFLGHINSSHNARLTRRFVAAKQRKTGRRAADC